MSARILSLCSGYLGLDMAVEPVLDARTVAVSDIDPGAARILAHRAPDVPNLGDVKTIRWEDWAGVEVMTAGYPCQPFSHAGKRAGTDDPRHIFPFIAEGIRRVGPRLVFLENVRGHLRLGFDVVLGTLADIGYDAQWVCLRASDVGACHKRERLFIVATPADAEHGGWDGRPHEPQRRSLRRTAPAGRRAEVGPGLTLLPTPAVNDMGAGKTVEAWDEWTAKMRAAHGNGNGHGASLSIEALRLLPTPRTSDTNGAGSHGDGGPDLRTVAALLPTPRATRGGSATETMALLPTPLVGSTAPAAHSQISGQWREAMANALQDWSVYEAAIRRHEAMLGRPAPSPTETGPKGGARLSPRFVEWMMCCPEGWVTDPAIGLTRNEQLRALGNGVVAPQAAEALRFMLSRQAVGA